MLKKYIRSIVFDIISNKPTIAADYRPEIENIKKQIEKINYELEKLEGRTLIRVDARGKSWRCDTELVPVQFAVNELIKVLGYNIEFQPESICLKEIKKDG